MVGQRSHIYNGVMTTIVHAGRVVLGQIPMSRPVNPCLADLDHVMTGRLWVSADTSYVDHLEELIVPNLPG